MNRCFRVPTARWVAVLFVMAANAAIAAPGQIFEENIDRPGQDFRNFDMTTPNASLCRRECWRDEKCQTWTYVKPGVQGPAARCWLKTGIPGAVGNGCCTSGVVGREQESNIDRPGGDYSSFPLSGANPQLCRKACADDARCTTWTYVKPGVQGPQAMCWLKGGMPAAFVNSCCDSGTIRRNFQHNIDRPHSDIGRTVEFHVDHCRNRCERDSRCVAWSFEKPRPVAPDEEPHGLCWLKDSIPAAVPNNERISGVNYQ